MDEQIVSFDVAKLAKEKGFNEKVLNYFQVTCAKNPSELSTPIKGNWNEYDVTYSRPTQSFLQKWLREKHNIEVDVLRYTYSGGIYQGRKYMYVVDQYNEKYNHELPENDEHWILNTIESSGYEYDNYENALEVALTEGLNLLKLTNNVDKH